MSTGAVVIGSSMRAVSFVLSVIAKDAEKSGATAVARYFESQAKAMDAFTTAVLSGSGSDATYGEIIITISAGLVAPAAVILLAGTTGLPIAGSVVLTVIAEMLVSEGIETTTTWLAHEAASALISGDNAVVDGTGYTPNIASLTPEEIGEIYADCFGAMPGVTSDQIMNTLDLPSLFATSSDVALQLSSGTGGVSGFVTSGGASLDDVQVVVDGDGNVRVDYRAPQTNLQTVQDILSIGGVGFTDGVLPMGLTFSFPIGGTDFSIEKVTFDSVNDYIKFDSKGLPENIEIDGVSGTDTLSLSGMDGNSSVKTVIDENGNKNLVIEVNGHTVTIKNIDRLMLGTGDVTLNAQNAVQEIFLGSGNTTIKHAASGTRIYVDAVGHVDAVVSDNVQLVGLKATDRVFLTGGGAALTGGLRWIGSETAYAYNTAMGVRYGINVEGDLVVEDSLRNKCYIANYVGGLGVPAAQNTAGIYVAEVDWTAYRLIDPRVPSNWQETQFQYVNALSKAYCGTQFYRGVDPIVLDLNGNGAVNLTDVYAGAPTFDMNGNDFAVSSGWVAPGDGLLVADKNGNGRIDGIDELFGSATEEGFSVLATYDVNADGVVNALDSGYAQLRVWRDLNGNHATDAEEMQTLTEAGIASIATAATAQNHKMVSGNQILAEGTFTRTDGSTGLVADVSFHVDNFNTTYLGNTSVSAAAALLPNLKGFGTLTDLRVAMSRDGVNDNVQRNVCAARAA